MAPDADTSDGGGFARLAETRFWEPHASPRSVWGLVATYPLLVLAVYRRSPRLLGATLISVAVHLGTTTPPTSDEAWATRVVLGERVWLERGLASEPADLGLVGVGAMVQGYTLRAALRRQPARTAVGTLASLALMLLFFDRMARLYDKVRSDGGALAGTEYL